MSSLCDFDSLKQAAAAAGSEMELSAIGEQVFAVESIVKKRVRKVGASCF